MTRAVCIHGMYILYVQYVQCTLYIYKYRADKDQQPYTYIKYGGFYVMRQVTLVDDRVPGKQKRQILCDKMGPLCAKIGTLCAEIGSQ